LPSGVQGLDVSAWQTLTASDWANIYAQGGRFAYTKATEGTDYYSSQFIEQFNDSANAGLMHGAYHYAQPADSSGAAQARYFVSHGGGWSPDGHTLPPMLDLEGGCYGLSQSAMVSWIMDYSNTLLSLIGVRPALYITTNWWITCTGNSALFTSNPLFIARWTDTPSNGPGTLPASWTAYTFWQWNDGAGMFPGDQDVFGGTYAQLQTLAQFGSSNPFGGFDLTGGDGKVTFGGWAIDPDTTAPIRVDVYVDGNGFASFQASSSRPDVGAVYTGYGSDHGISATYPIAEGQHNICVYAINVGLGGNTLLGCKGITIVQSSPFGGTSIQTGPGSVSLTGWVIDPDTVDSVRVDVYLDGTGFASFQADADRPDVGTAYPAFGPNHGIDESWQIPAGQHTLCVYGINVGPGSNTLLNCYTVTVQGGSPFGGIDVTTTPGSVTLHGWDIDPDTTAAVRTDVYLDGKGFASFQANASRPDVGAVYPAFGPNHGIDQTWSVAAGTHTLCAWAINVGGGSNTMLGCETFTLPGGSPFGGTDLTVAAGSMTLHGWVIDPDTTAAVRTDVYLDGVGFASFQANASRPDVGKVYPAYGAAHGIDRTWSISPGTHSLCVYGINVGVGSNTLLNCFSFTVLSGSPFGGTDVTVAPGAVTMHGWVIDPDTTSSVRTDIYMDGKGFASFQAGASRPDVGAAYPGYGSNHGIDQTWAVSSGTHTICAWGINVGPGENRLLACQSITVP
jgi:GH25 family lysozyme M1 (1,4-beta-N-acetylmuramidase)